MKIKITETQKQKVIEGLVQASKVNGYLDKGDHSAIVHHYHAADDKGKEAILSTVKAHAKGGEVGANRILARHRDYKKTLEETNGVVDGITGANDERITDLVEAEKVDNGMEPTDMSDGKGMPDFKAKETNEMVDVGQESLDEEEEPIEETTTSASSGQYSSKFFIGAPGKESDHLQYPGGSVVHVNPKTHTSGVGTFTKKQLKEAAKADSISEQTAEAVNALKEEFGGGFEIDEVAAPKPVKKGMPRIPQNVIKKVAEVQALIKQCVDEVGDQRGVVDNTGTITGDEQCYTVTIVGNRVYIGSQSVYSSKPDGHPEVYDFNKDFLRSQDWIYYDCVDMLTMLIRMYKKSIKQLTGGTGHFKPEPEVDEAQYFPELKPHQDITARHDDFAHYKQFKGKKNNHSVHEDMPMDMTTQDTDLPDPEDPMNTEVTGSTTEEPQFTTEDLKMILQGVIDDCGEDHPTAKHLMMILLHQGDLENPDAPISPEVVQAFREALPEPGTDGQETGNDAAQGSPEAPIEKPEGEDQPQEVTEGQVDEIFGFSKGEKDAKALKAQVAQAQAEIQRFTFSILWKQYQQGGGNEQMIKLVTMSLNRAGNEMPTVKALMPELFERRSQGTGAADCQCEISGQYYPGIIPSQWNPILNNQGAVDEEKAKVTLMRYISDKYKLGGIQEDDFNPIHEYGDDDMGLGNETDDEFNHVLQTLYDRHHGRFDSRQIPLLANYFKMSEEEVLQRVKDFRPTSAAERTDLKNNLGLNQKYGMDTPYMTNEYDDYYPQDDKEWEELTSHPLPQREPEPYQGGDNNYYGGHEDEVDETTGAASSGAFSAPLNDEPINLHGYEPGIDEDLDGGKSMDGNFINANLADFTDAEGLLRNAFGQENVHVEKESHAGSVAFVRIADGTEFKIGLLKDGTFFVKMNEDSYDNYNVFDSLQDIIKAIQSFSQEGDQPNQEMGIQEEYSKPSTAMSFLKKVHAATADITKAETKKAGEVVKKGTETAGVQFTGKVEDNVDQKKQFDQSEVQTQLDMIPDGMEDLEYENEQSPLFKKNFENGLNPNLKSPDVTDQFGNKFKGEDNANVVDSGLGAKLVSDVKKKQAVAAKEEPAANFIQRVKVVKENTEMVIDEDEQKRIDEDIAKMQKLLGFNPRTYISTKGNKTDNSLFKSKK